MKIVQINTTCGVGSTGKICVGISELLTRDNVENYIFYSEKTNGYGLGIGFADHKYIKFQALKSRVFGNYGFNSKKETEKMIAELDRIAPDIVHLHNIHGHDCDLEALLTYFKEKRTKLIWTFHDCWAFTGYCTYFTMSKCDKWQESCSNCVQHRKFSWFFDRSAALFEKKKQLCEGLDLTVVTPSEWLADLVRKSFLKDCPIQVIHNGIDLKVFQPILGEFRQKYRLENKKIVLGVAAGWEARKGLDVFVDLSKRLPEEYQIVLVGTNSEIDRLLPKNIISIHRTQNQRELAEIYSEADIFANPTRDEVFGLVNVEALACGTPGVTFKSGGSPECYDETCGTVVECDDLDALEREIKRICTEHPYSREACIKKAATFDQDIRFHQYLDLYKKIGATENNALGLNIDLK